MQGDGAATAALAQKVCASGGDPSGELLRDLASPLSASAFCDCPNELVNVPLDWSISFKPDIQVYYTVLGLLGVAVVAANLAIVVGIARDPKIQQLHNLLVAGQALSDLAVGFLAVVFNFGTLFNGSYMLGGEAGCSVYGFGIVMTCQTTVFSLCLIAYSRKVRILENRHLSMRRMALLYVGGVWGLSFVLLGVYVLLTTARMSCSRAFCNPIWNEGVIIVNGITLGLPIAYTVSVYYRIHQRLRETMRAVAATLCDRGGQEIYSRNKTTRLMVLMSASILVLWTPLYVFYLFSVYKLASGRNPGGMDVMERLLGISAVGSSLASPIIYAFKNKTLKLAMQYSFLPMSWKHAAADRERARAIAKQQRRNASLQKLTSTTEYTRSGVPECQNWSPRGCCCGPCSWIFEASNIRGTRAAVASNATSSLEAYLPKPGSRTLAQRYIDEEKPTATRLRPLASVELAISEDNQRATFWEEGHYARRASCSQEDQPGHERTPSAEFGYDDDDHGRENAEVLGGGSGRLQRSTEENEYLADESDQVESVTVQLS